MKIAAGSKRGSRAFARRLLHMGAAVSSVMMVVIPAFAQSPAEANTKNQRVTRPAQTDMNVTVADPTNALIREATVILWRASDTVTFAAKTDSRGVARCRGLSKGTYKIIVQAPGFRTLQQTVTVKKLEHIRVKLEIAVKAERIEVTAAPPVIDTIVNVTGEPLPLEPYRTLGYPIHLAII